MLVGGVDVPQVYVTPVGGKCYHMVMGGAPLYTCHSTVKRTSHAHHTPLVDAPDKLISHALQWDRTK